MTFQAQTHKSCLHSNHSTHLAPHALCRNEYYIMSILKYVQCKKTRSSGRICKYIYVGRCVYRHVYTVVHFGMSHWKSVCMCVCKQGMLHALWDQVHAEWPFCSVSKELKNVDSCSCSLPTSRVVSLLLLFMLMNTFKNWSTITQNHYTLLLLYSNNLLFSLYSCGSNSLDGLWQRVWEPVGLQVGV